MPSPNPITLGTTAPTEELGSDTSQFITQTHLVNIFSESTSQGPSSDLLDQISCVTQSHSTNVCVRVCMARGGYSQPMLGEIQPTMSKYSTKQAPRKKKKRIPKSTRKKKKKQKKQQQQRNLQCWEYRPQR